MPSVCPANNWYIYLADPVVTNPITLALQTGNNNEREEKVDEFDK